MYIPKSPQSFAFAITFVLLLFIQNENACAQGKFLDGYTITSKGDTIQGSIRYESWDVSPSFIDFVSGKNETVQKLTGAEITEFFIPSIGQRFKRKKIGLLNIDLSQTYELAPSLQPKDSATVFLQEITSGTNASLFEFVNNLGEPHFFLEKNGQTVELINYPFYRITKDKKYLLTYDEYRRQLPALLDDASDFNAPIPTYDRRNLKKYIEKYNAKFGVSSEVFKSDESDFQIDLNVNAGIEGWQEERISISNKMSYSVGLRINLPRKFNNRYFRFNYAMIPLKSRDGINYTHKTIEFGAGTYFGAKKIRPNIGMDYSFPLNNWRTTLIGPHIGISYNRTFSIEVAHFANFNTLFSEIAFFNKPRISLNYYLNLNKLIKRKN